jgi:hypothetical protein
MSMRTSGEGVALLCFRTTALVGALLAAACGGGDSASLPDPGPMSGIDPSTALDTLTPAEATMLCQWTAGRMGGYSRTIVCGSNTLSSESSSQCDSAGGMLAGCSATVGTVESCVNGVVEQSPCTAFPSQCINLLLDCGTPM